MLDRLKNEPVMAGFLAVGASAFATVPTPTTGFAAGLPLGAILGILAPLVGLVVRAFVSPTASKGGQ